jgi:hypothetical protein
MGKKSSPNTPPPKVVSTPGIFGGRRGKAEPAVTPDNPPAQPRVGRPRVGPQYQVTVQPWTGPSTARELAPPAPPTPLSDGFLHFYNDLNDGDKDDECKFYTIDSKGRRVYMVEDIVDARVILDRRDPNNHRKVIRYLIQWRGYPGEDTWEPFESLSTAVCKTYRDKLTALAANAARATSGRSLRPPPRFNDPESVTEGSGFDFRTHQRWDEAEEKEMQKKKDEKDEEDEEDEEDDEDVITLPDRCDELMAFSIPESGFDKQKEEVEEVELKKDDKQKEEVEEVESNKDDMQKEKEEEVMTSGKKEEEAIETGKKKDVMGSGKDCMHAIDRNYKGAFDSDDDN